MSTCQEKECEAYYLPEPLVSEAAKAFIAKSGASILKNKSLVFLFPRAQALVQCICVDRIPQETHGGHDEGAFVVLSRLPVKNAMKWQFAQGWLAKGIKPADLPTVMSRDRTDGAWSTKHVAASARRCTKQN